MNVSRRKLARRAHRVNAELGLGGRGKDLGGKGLGFHSCVCGKKYLPLIGFTCNSARQDKLQIFFYFKERQKS